MGILDSLFRSARNEIKQNIRQDVNKAASQAACKYYSYTFQSLPQNLAEMKAMPQASLHDPAAVACLVLMALDRYP